MTDRQPKADFDFNTAESQQNFNLIPQGVIATVNMTLKPGGYNDLERGLAGGYATHKTTSGAIYLSCEFVILDGPYAKRKVWSLIGLHSPKGPEWGHIGRSFIRAILNSARGFAETDDSPQAIAARKIHSFADLDGIEFTAKIEVEKNKENGQERNVIKIAIPKDHKEYPSENHALETPLQRPLSQTPLSGPDNAVLPDWAT